MVTCCQGIVAFSFMLANESVDNLISLVESIYDLLLEANGGTFYSSECFRNYLEFNKSLKELMDKKYHHDMHKFHIENVDLHIAYSKLDEKHKELKQSSESKRLELENQIMNLLSIIDSKNEQIRVISSAIREEKV